MSPLDLDFSLDDDPSPKSSAPAPLMAMATQPLNATQPISALPDNKPAMDMDFGNATITLDTPVLVALSLMTRRRIRHLPVVEGGRMVGFVSIGDLVKFRIQRIEAEAAALRDYIAS